MVPLSLRRLLADYSQRSVHAAAPSRRALTQRERKRLHIEALEDRLVFSFTPPALYATPPAPHAVAVADFRGDGHLDLVTVNAAPFNSVSIFLGRGDGTFTAAGNYAAGANPANVAVADFNGDGTPDLAVTNAGDGTVSILFGNGDGTFRPGGTYYAGSHPVAIAAADFNGDGFPDLLVTDADPVNQVLSLPNNGRGGFPFHASYATGRNPVALAVGDFNGDGILDFVTADALDQEVRYYQGNGDATFQPGLPFHTGLAQDVAAADFSGSGILDLVTAGGDASAGLGFSPGNGNGTFQQTVTFPVEVGTARVAVADFNGDGQPDVVTVDQQTDNLSVLYGYGGPRFQTAFSFPSGLGRGANPTAVAVGDFDGDGYPDLAVTDQNFNYLAILINHPQTTHLQVTAPAASTAGTEATITVTALDEGNVPAPQFRGTVHFASTDRNAALPADYTFTAADQGVHTFTVALRTAGNQSVAVTDTSDSSIAGNAAIAVDPAAASSFRVRRFPSPVTAGTSGTLTVTARDPYGNTATGYTGSVRFTSSDNQAMLPGVYRFAAADQGTATFTAILKTAGAQSLTVTDTGDSSITGRQSGIEVIPAAASRLVLTAPATAAPHDSLALTVTARDPYNNIATGYLGTVHFTSSDFRASLPADYTFTVADAGVHHFSAALVTLGHQTITVRDTINAALTANAPVTVAIRPLFGPPVNLPVGADPWGIATGDFNGDGFLDIVVANRGGNSYSIILGNGDGTFQTTTTYALGPAPSSVAVADLTGNGILDLVFAMNGGNTVGVLLGNGDGTFQAPLIYPVGSQPIHVAVADLTGDGIPDIVVANYAARTVSVLLGDGTGHFGPATSFPIAGNPWWVAVGDFNGDGIPDLVTANDGSTVSILLGNGDGTFVPAQSLTAEPNPRTVEVGDFNGDGIADLAVGNYESGTISVYLGNGNGTFKSPTNYYEFSQGPQGMVLADVTGDGYLDIVTVNQGGGVWVLLNTGDGTFQPPLQYQAGSIPLFLAVADFNGDGAPDLAVSNRLSNNVSILFNLAQATTFDVQAPDDVVAGIAFEVSVTARNAFGGIAIGYRGIVHFTSTDAAGTLPSDYQFTAADQGVHTFLVTLATPGTQVLTVADLSAGAPTGSVAVTVTAPAASRPMVPDQGRRAWLARALPEVSSPAVLHRSLVKTAPTDVPWSPPVHCLSGNDPQWIEHSAHSLPVAIPEFRRDLSVSLHRLEIAPFDNEDPQEEQLGSVGLL